AYHGGSNIPEFWIEVENAPIVVGPIFGRKGPPRDGFVTVDPITGRFNNPGGAFGIDAPITGRINKLAAELSTAEPITGPIGKPGDGFGTKPIIGGNDKPPYGIRPRSDSLLYFCFSDNSQLRDYWKRVQDGLNKIRHCLTIAGVKSERPLYDPPIDPLVLVRAAATGRDISSVLAEVFRPVSHYRFTYMIERAKGLAAQVQQLGGAFLSVLEKQDVEQLALLRSTHEQNILKLTLTLKQQQEEEAAASHDALVESRRSAASRRKHYQGLISASYIPNETLYFVAADIAAVLEAISAAGRLAASVNRLFVLAPDGKDFGEALEYTAGSVSATAGV